MGDVGGAFAGEASSDWDEGGLRDGDCGTCIVLVEGGPVNSCLVLAVDVKGRQVLTIEGLGGGGRVASFAGEFFGEGSGAVWFLHAGDDDEREGDVGPGSRGRGGGDQEGLIRGFVPVWFL